MNINKVLLLFWMLLISSTLTYGISISCDCSEVNCRCTSDCSHGLLDIYGEGCGGFPSYELPLSKGKAMWLPPQEGEYHLKVLCDNHEESQCEVIKVPSPKKKEKPRTKFLPYLFLFSIVVMVALLIYMKFQKKKDLEDIKKKVKE